MRRNGWAPLMAGMALSLALAGCATGSAAPTATPEPEPTATPAAALGMFTGRDECSDADAEGAPDTGGVACDRVATDPRLTGTYTSSGPGGTGSDPDVFIEWRTFRMVNDGGTWQCKQLVMGVPGGAGWDDQVCHGYEGYSGLTAYVHALSDNNASDWGVLGWIEESP